MKKTRSALALALAVPVLWAATRARDRVEFKVADGQQLTKTFRFKAEMSQDSMSATVNGMEQDTSGLEMSVVTEELATVKDSYGGTSAGRPTKLTRNYEKLSNQTSMVVKHPAMGEQEMEFSGKSELEGLTVRFALGEDGEYDVEFDESSKADEELLVDLWEDMDLRVLLPAGEVKPGDSWSLDESLLASLLAPGGNLKVVPEAAGDDEMMMGGSAKPTIAEMLGEIHAQEASATYAGIEERGGDKVGVVKIKLVKLTSAKDLTEYAQTMLERQDTGEGMEISVESADVELEMDAEGELLWDLEGGHIYSLELTGTVRFTEDSSAQVSMQGNSMRVESSSEMSGSFTRSVALGEVE